jgi:hypothetical protein
MKPEGSLPHSQEPATCPYPEHWFKQSRLNCSSCRIEAQYMDLIWIAEDVKLINISGTKKETDARENLRSSKKQNIMSFYTDMIEFKKG